MRFRTDSERFRDMSSELAKRVRVAVNRSSRRHKMGSPDIIIFGRPIPVSCVLDHYDVSTGMF